MGRKERQDKQTLRTEYPLVTHDPNMLKKVTGKLIWKIKVSLPERKYENFR